MVPLTFYRGDTTGEIDWIDTANDTRFYLLSAVGTDYTVKAEYISGDGKIMAFDSDRMTLKDYGDQCGDPCYIVKGGIFDLQLMAE